MHELSLCQRILEIISEQTMKEGCHRVKKITLVIGKLVGIDLKTFEFCFEVAKKGTIVTDANVEVIEIEGKAICNFCKETVILNNYYDGCMHCGNFSLTVQQGEEFLVQSMEVE